MFVLWYCHKRGREVRLEAEAAARAIDGKDRIEELPDDPVLPAPHPIPARDPILTPDREESLTPGHGKPPPRALHGKSVGVSQGRSTPPKKHRDRERD